jgi:hypothetical protein
MLTSNQYFIRERSEPILIKKNLTTNMKINSPKGEYSLKQNFFDPTKSSPPNEFMIKLHMRMNKYYLDKDMVDDSLDIK